MKNLFLSCLVVGVIGLAFWAYTENYETKGKLDAVSYTHLTLPTKA